MSSHDPAEDDTNTLPFTKPSTQRNKEWNISHLTVFLFALYPASICYIFFMPQIISLIYLTLKMD